MTWIDVLTTSVFALGIFATAISFFLGRKFWRLETGLSKPLAFMAWGGALAGASTLAFSFASMFHFYWLLTDVTMSVLRIFIFLGITGSDIYMLLKLRSLERNG